MEVTEKKGDTPEHQCEFCKRILDTQIGLDRHRVKYHGTEVGSFSCEKCNRFFKTIGNLERHKHLTHNFNNSSRFECGECPSSFKNHHHLIQHQRTIHSGEVKKYQCTKCSKTFVRRDTFVQHVHNSHSTVIIMHKCEFCLKLYSSKPSLKNHIKMNHNINHKKSKCPYCPSEYKWPGHLKSHILKVHVKSTTSPHDFVKKGLRSIRSLDNSCVICYEKFPLKLNLLLHLKQIHNQDIDIYKCCQCNAVFTLKGSLYMHLKEHRLSKKPRVNKNSNNGPDPDKKQSEDMKQQNSPLTNENSSLKENEQGYKNDELTALQTKLLDDEDTTEIECHKCDQCFPRFSPKLYSDETSNQTDDNLNEVQKEIIDFELTIMEDEDLRRLIRYRVKHSKKTKHFFEGNNFEIPITYSDDVVNIADFTDTSFIKTEPCVQENDVSFDESTNSQDINFNHLEQSTEKDNDKTPEKNIPTVIMQEISENTAEKSFENKSTTNINKNSETKELKTNNFSPESDTMNLKRQRKNICKFCGLEFKMHYSLVNHIQDDHSGTKTTYMFDVLQKNKECNYDSVDKSQLIVQTNSFTDSEHTIAEINSETLDNSTTKNMSNEVTHQILPNPKKNVSIEVTKTPQKISTLPVLTYKNNNIEDIINKNKFNICEKILLIKLERLPPNTYKTIQEKISSHDSQRTRQKSEEIHKNDSKCPQCNKNFKNNFAFNQHFRLKHLKTRFKCSHCKSVFENKQALNNHEIDIHSNEKLTYKCEKCNIFVETKELLNCHIQSLHNDTITNKEMPRNLSSNSLQESLTEQRVDDISNVVTESSASETISFNSDTVSKNKQSAFLDSQNIASVNKTTKTQKQKLTIENICNNQEAKELEQKKIHKCVQNVIVKLDLVDKDLYSAATAKTDSIIGNQITNVDKNIQGNDDFKRKHVEQIRKRFHIQKCKTCKQVFPNLNKLVQHVKKVHGKHGKKPAKFYKCKLCNFTSKFVSHIAGHARKDHKKIKKNFTTASGTPGKEILRSPVIQDAMSVDERTVSPMSLEVLNITSKKSLSKSYECGKCVRFFTSKLGLLRHISEKHLSTKKGTNNKNRIAVCDYCKETFLDKLVLISHIKENHENSIKCNQCNKTFKNENYLQKHKRIAHAKCVCF